MPTINFTSPEGKEYSIPVPKGVGPDQYDSLVQHVLSHDHVQNQMESVNKDLDNSPSPFMAGVKALPNAFAQEGKTIAISTGNLGLELLQGGAGPGPFHTRIDDNGNLVTEHYLDYSKKVGDAILSSPTVKGSINAAQGNFTQAGQDFSQIPGQAWEGLQKSPVEGGFGLIMGAKMLGGLGEGIGVLGKKAYNTWNIGEGDFVQSRSDPGLYGRVVTDASQSGLKKTYAVQTPEGLKPLSVWDIDHYIKAPNVDAGVVVSPEDVQVYGKKVGPYSYSFDPSAAPEPGVPEYRPNLPKLTAPEEHGILKQPGVPPLNEEILKSQTAPEKSGAVSVSAASTLPEQNITPGTGLPLKLVDRLKATGSIVDTSQSSLDNNVPMPGNTITGIENDSRYSNDPNKPGLLDAFHGNNGETWELHKSGTGDLWRVVNNDSAGKNILTWNYKDYNKANKVFEEMRKDAIESHPDLTKEGLSTAGTNSGVTPRVVTPTEEIGHGYTISQETGINDKKPDQPVWVVRDPNGEIDAWSTHKDRNEAINLSSASPIKNEADTNSILRTLQRHGDLSSADLWRLADISPADITEYINKAMSDGDIVKAKNGKYKLSSQGADKLSNTDQISHLPSTANPDLDKPVIDSLENTSEALPSFDNKTQQDLNTTTALSAISTESTGGGTGTTTQGVTPKSTNPAHWPQLSVEESAHTKTGEKMWVVKSATREARSTYEEMKKSALKNNGYWSSFAKGFVFKNSDDAHAFMGINKSGGTINQGDTNVTNTNTTETPAATGSQQAATAGFGAVGTDRLAEPQNEPATNVPAVNSIGAAQDLPEIHGTTGETSGGGSGRTGLNGNAGERDRLAAVHNASERGGSANNGRTDSADSSPNSVTEQHQRDIESAGARLTETPDIAATDLSQESAVPTTPVNNYLASPEEGNIIATTTRSVKIRNLLSAIETLKEIESEGRLATPAEQVILARFPGWGWTANLLHEKNFDPKSPDYNAFKQIKELLNDKEMNAAIKAKQNSHYTDPAIIASMWSALKSLGFTGGNILEPSAGIGLFASFQPLEIATNSKWRMVELDDMTGRILKQLQQGARVDIKGFERTMLPKDRFDLVVSNVPFGNIAVQDKEMIQRGDDILTRRIHNYFIARSIDVTRPGGMIAVITSEGTLNANDPIARATRQYMADNAAFLGAIRLPNNTFVKNANTEVTTDMIFLQKKGEGVDLSRDKSFQEVDNLGSAESPINVNEYFTLHPEMALGTHSNAGSMYREGQYTLNPDTSRPFEEQLAEAIARLPVNVYSPSMHPVADIAESDTNNITSQYSRTRRGTLQVQNGKVVSFDPESGLKEVELSPKDIKIVESYAPIRSAFVDLIEAQKTVSDDRELKPLQDALKKAYKDYTKAHGPLHKSSSPWIEDPDGDNILALENWDAKKKEVTGLSDIFSKRVARPTLQVDHVDNVKDALTASKLITGRIHMGYMAKITGLSEADLGDQLSSQGLIFHDPNSGWVAADEYGSGNVRVKLSEAQEMAKKDPSFQRNVDYLQTRQPKILKAGEVSAKLGAQWIPLDVYQAFIAHLYDSSHPEWIKILHTPFSGEWNILNSFNSAAADAKWATSRTSTQDLLEGLMNGKSPTVYDTVGYDENGKPIKRINEGETSNARLKQDLIRDEWNSWVYSNGERANRLADIYNNTINVYRNREFDGSHLEMPGANPMWNWRAHQLNAIWRTLQSQYVLYAHDVGTGKTATIIGAIMELRRIGLRNKPMWVCHNSNIDDMASSFKYLYPGARTLVADDKNFHTGVRRQFLAKIASGDYDAVLITQSAFKLIPSHPDTINSFYQDQITQMREFLMQHKAEGGKDATVRQIGKMISSLEKKLQSKVDKLEKQDKNLYFEDLGVDQLMVDEAHYYKNLMLASQMDGMSSDGSDTAFDMYMKIKSLTANGGGVGFATGTPITNSVAELHTILRYLAPDLLRTHQMEHFDSWAQTFAEHNTTMERNVAGDFKNVGRLSKFSNIPELMQMYLSVVDPVTADAVPELKRPKLIDRTGKEIGRPIIVESNVNESQLNAFQKLLDRADALKNAGKPEKGSDNMLAISSDGRHISLDVRLRIGNAPDYPGSKVNKVVDNVLWEYNRPAAMKNKAAQVIFCDLGTGNNGKFSIYDDIKKKLIAGGIPAKEISFVQSAKNDDAREALFEKVNNGDIRVLIGSREKMGVGVNIQQRLIAGHQVDPTWRPDWLEQADGRVLRHGNMFDGVRMYQYVTKGSFDEFMWNNVGRKAKFINSVTKGDVNVREAEDIAENEQFSYDQMKAAASGNPEYVELINSEDKLKKLQGAMLAHQNNMQSVANQAAGYKARVESLKARNETLAKIDQYNQSHPVPDPWKLDIEGKPYTSKKDAAVAIFNRGSKMDRWDNPVKVGEYRGHDLYVEYISQKDTNSKGNLVEVDGAKVKAICQDKSLFKGMSVGEDRQYPGTFTVNITESGASSLWSRIDKLIDVSNEISKNQDEINHREQEIPKLIQESKTPFSKMDDIRSLRERVNALTQKLQASERKRGWGSDVDNVERLEEGKPSANAPKASRTRKKMEEGAVNLAAWQKITDYLNRTVKDVKVSVADALLGNAQGIQQYGSSSTLMAFAKLAGSKGYVASMLQGPGMEIHKLMRDLGGIERFIGIVDESRLRGIRASWDGLADRAINGDVTEPLKTPGRLTLAGDLIRPLDALTRAHERYAGVLATARTLCLRAEDEANDSALRDYLFKVFSQARDNTKTIIGFENGVDQFYELISNPVVQKCLDIWSRTMEPEMHAAHIEQDGDEAIFSSRLGPLGVYGPLIRLNDDGSTYGGLSSAYATGQADDYDTSVEGLGRALNRAVRKGALKELIEGLKNDGLVQSVSAPAGHTGPWQNPNIRELTHDGQKKTEVYVAGKWYAGREVPISQAKLIASNKADKDPTYVPPQMVVAPNWIIHEIAPAIYHNHPEWGGQPSKIPVISDILGVGNTMGIVGNPLDLTIHANNIESILLSEAQPGERLNPAARAALNMPYVKRIATIANTVHTDPMSPINQQHILDMGKMGLIPERYGEVTHNPDIAAATGSKYVPLAPLFRIPESTVTEHTTNGQVLKTEPAKRGIGLPSLTPEVFGRTGADIRARLIMYRHAMIMAGMDPEQEWPKDPVSGKLLYPDKQVEVMRFVMHVGSYVRAMEAGLVRWLKDTRVGPFAEASSTFMRNGARAWLDYRAPGPTKGTSAGNKFQWSGLGWRVFNSALALLVVWAAIHKHNTGKWPWEDPDAQLGYEKMPDGKMVNVMGLANPAVSRGARVTGIAAGSNTYNRTHDVKATEDALTRAWLNAAVRPAFGPGTSAMYRAITLQEPYVTSMYDKHTGRPQLQGIPAVESVNPGIDVGQHVGAGLLGINTAAEKSLAAAGFEPAVKATREQDLSTTQRWLNVATDIALPDSFKEPYNPPHHSSRRRSTDWGNSWGSNSWGSSSWGGGIGGGW